MAVSRRRNGWLLPWSDDALARERFRHQFLITSDRLAALMSFGRWRIERCIFCDCRLRPGSEEHVLPSAIGGRMRTRSATCISCNTAFARGDKVDDSVGDCFVIPRCALSIWTGRREPPPTLPRVGRFDDGSEYDLGPGFVPIVRPAKVPQINGEGTIQIAARDLVDANRVVDILRKRGCAVEPGKIKAANVQVPTAKLSINFDGVNLARAMAKSAITAACVLHGNVLARRRFDFSLARAALLGAPDIRDFAGWDYWNQWPRVTSLSPHRIAKDPSSSGFEHTILFSDVGDDWIAYITLFGYFRFSVRMGQASGLPAAGIALNPRSLTYSRFEVKFVPPESFTRHYATQFSQEFALVKKGVEESLNAVLAKWYSEASDALQDDRADELSRRLEQAGDEEDKRREAYIELMSKWMTIDSGETWAEDL